MTEILSPCGGADSVSAAVRAGADAVYLGVGGYNARHGAKNFTEEEFGKATEYCRINGVKVYVTLNTLITDKEVGDALALAERLALLGADAFIVQDIGFASALHSRLPDMPLHASTQMSIHSHLGLTLLKKLGFCRVVAAREMSRDGLKKLCTRAKELDMEVEVFVHGALCMCMSGQCLMSSMIGGRSGNRGRCAQPCRLPFSVKNGTGYDLSLKDLSLTGELRELEKLGVTSFKIEGRMKRPEYVAAATAACREGLDTGYVDENLSKLLYDVFSRDGFTEGYYVNQIGRDMFGRRLDADRADTATLSGIHELYRTERQHIPLKLEFFAESGKPMRLTGSDGEHTAEVTAIVPGAAAKRGTTADEVAKKLLKFGGTCYSPDDVKISVGDGINVSGGTVGEMRRELVSLMDGLRSVPAKRAVSDYTPASRTTAKSDKKTAIVARFRTPEQIPDDISGISAVILPVETDFSSVHLSVPLWAELPRGIMGTEDRVREMLENALPYINGAVAENLGGLELALRFDISVVTGAYFNISNTLSADTVKMLGASGYTASIECDAGDIAAMPDGNAFIAYGRVPLMLTRNCPNRNGNGCRECDGVSEGTDRLGNRFPIACRNGFSEIFNTKPCWLLDRTDEFRADTAVLYFTFEQKDEAARIISAALRSGKPEGDYTRGLYYRTVM